VTEKKGYDLIMIWENIIVRRQIQN